MMGIGKREWEQERKKGNKRQRRNKQKGVTRRREWDYGGEKGRREV